MKTRAQRRRSAATAPHGAARSRARAMLEDLPLPAREQVVLLLPTREQVGLHGLPLISQGTLASLKELRLPIGEFRAYTVEEAVRQAHALRAWDLGTLDMSHTDVADVSALAGCAALHTLKLSHCDN